MKKSTWNLFGFGFGKNLIFFIHFGFNQFKNRVLIM